MPMISEWWMWLSFIIFVIGMLVVDLVICGGNKAHRISTKEAATWSVVWIGLALIFNLLLCSYLSHKAGPLIANQRALEFFSGYLIEKSLSIDNIFVFIMIFNYFSIPAEYQHRVLIYGVIGAVVMRLIMILAGAWLINQFHWTLYIFGLLLLILAVKMFLKNDKKINLEQHFLVKWIKKYLRVTPELHQERFFVTKNRLLYLTPLFLVLILIEISDLIFAVDSIPAIFAITNDPFIVFTSNIFAILGLRALYFLLRNLADRFYYLRHGLAILLGFVGIKLIITEWVKIPIGITLAFIFIILAICVLLSVRRSKSLNSAV